MNALDKKRDAIPYSTLPSLKILMHGVWGAMEHLWNAFHCYPNPYILKVKRPDTAGIVKQ